MPPSMAPNPNFISDDYGATPSVEDKARANRDAWCDRAGHGLGE